MKIAYARVSTLDQNLNRQIQTCTLKNIKENLIVCRKNYLMSATAYCVATQTPISNSSSCFPDNKRNENRSCFL